MPVVKGSYAVPGNTGRHYDVSRDGRKFLLLVDVKAEGQKSTAPEMRLVLNWTEDLKAKVPDR